MFVSGDSIKGFNRQDIQNLDNFSDMFSGYNKYMYEDIEKNLRPQKVYDEPANLFVAKFLGSPAINVFDGEIDGGKLLLNGAVIDEDEKYTGEKRNVKIAVRPESFEYKNDSGNVPVIVTSVEHIGRDITVNGYVKNQDVNHVKVIIPSELRNEILGKEELVFRAKRIYVFEETGERIK